MHAMTIRVASAWAASTLMLVAAHAADAPITKSFYEDGSWRGEVTARKWRGIDTAKAWAFGRHSQKNAEEACSGREDRADRRRCIRGLLNGPPIEIFANCRDGVAWSNRDKERYRLSAKAKVGELDPLEDEAAWTTQLSHRARWTVSSWFALLCPKASKRWRIAGSGDK